MPQSSGRASDRAIERSSDRSSLNTSRQPVFENNQRQSVPSTMPSNRGQSNNTVSRTPVIRPRTVEVAPSVGERSTPSVSRNDSVSRDSGSRQSRTITSDGSRGSANRSTKSTADAIVRGGNTETRTDSSALREKVTTPVRVESSDVSARADRVTTDGIRERTADRNTAKSGDRATERAADKAIAKDTKDTATNRTADRAARDSQTRTETRDRDRATDGQRDTQRAAADRTTERAADRTADRTTDRSTDRTVADRVTSRDRGDRTIASAGRTATDLKEETRQRARVSGTRQITGGRADVSRQRIINATETKRVVRNYETNNTSKLVVNGNNNVIVQGNVNIRRPRPYIAPRLYHRDLAYHHRHDWHDHGTYFSFGWSTGSCGSVIWAPYHSYYGFSYYYPSYHRKYVFVSIGGYWPVEYRYRRYYWYGCHPHYWYGTYIVNPDPVVYQNTYNTYNNYYNTAPADTTATTTNVYDNPPLTQTTDVVDTIDAPNDENIVDVCFAHGVKVFGEGNYAEAIERFRRAVQMDPQDVILPFTYSQALFANGDYAMSASVLRGAVQNIPDDELTIYYPRGLYEDEKVLNEQIQRLESAIAGEPFVADYQLLLGYQYLGLDQLDKCRGPLTEAAKDAANRDTANKLLELADRLEAEKAKAAEDKTVDTNPSL